MSHDYSLEIVHQRKGKEKENVPHSSFLEPYKSNASQCLSINVSIVPSCVYTSDISMKKKPIIETSTLSGQKRKATDENEDTGNDDSTIIKMLSKALPPMKAPESIELDKDGYLLEPIGESVVSYNVASKDFIVTLASGTAPHINDYHQSIQNLALFFIENADGVDLTSDEGGGKWVVMYLFQKHSDENVVRYSLAGYMTLFLFFSPFKKPVGGNIVRICQALILPPYQRQGHGKRLMDVCYQYAKGEFDTILKEQSNIVEVNVEDPAPGFVQLRDAVDYALLSKYKEKGDCSICEKYFKDGEYLLMNDADATNIGVKLHITKTQVQIAYEICKLCEKTKYLQKHGESTEAGDKEEMEKNFRLMVKKRLNSLHKEEIGACATKTEKQAMLTKIYDETIAGYKKILKYT